MISSGSVMFGNSFTRRRRRREMQVTIRVSLGGLALKADGTKIGCLAGCIERRLEALDVADQRGDRERRRLPARVARELRGAPSEETSSRAHPSVPSMVQAGGDLDQPL